MEHVVSADAFRGALRTVRGRRRSGWGRFEVSSASSGGVDVSARVRTGACAGAQHAWFDVLLNGGRFVTFRFRLSCGGKTVFKGVFSPLTECQTRIVLSLAGADLAAVDAVHIGIERKTDRSARFAFSPVTFTDHEPPVLRQPALPRGPLVDEMGLSRLHDWPGKPGSVAALNARLKTAVRAAATLSWPKDFSRWGGWKGSRIRSPGFFRTHHDGRRWWLVDPDGHLFWSAGADCVHATIDHESKIETRHMDLRAAHAHLPGVLGTLGRAYRVNPWHGKSDREFNYLEANFARAFGPERWYDAWQQAAFGELRRIGFNTAADWSDEHAASRAGVPYTRALELDLACPHTPVIAPGMPDVFHAQFRRDAEAGAERLRETRGDPAMIGYFLNNEPAWHAHACGPAEGMLRQTDACATRDALSAWLRKRYRGDAGLRGAWGMPVSQARIRRGRWSEGLTPAAAEDLKAFSTRIVDRYIRVLSAACRRVDPDHLNLGVRWWSFPPVWALKGMGACDVISFNYYEPKVDMVPYMGERDPAAPAVLSRLNRPCLVGEWHFGSLDEGLPSAGLRRVRDSRERGKAYRVYLEHAAALPWCVGAHWFTFYDRNALYCASSNENYGVGFIDVAHGRHEPICRAARASHERLYSVASGRARPFDVPVEHVFPSR